jgi:hypothetical protein
VGVNEARSGTTAGAAPTNVYWAFWTDPIHHYLPITLFPVRAGDQVSATLSLARGRWTVSISDTDSHASAVFSTAEEASASFDQAEWLQEDVSSSDPTSSYPALSPISFAQVGVNGAPPSQDRLYPAWMSAGGETVAPTRPSGDSFTIRPLRPSTLELRYLDLAVPEDAAQRTFAYQVTHLPVTATSVQIGRQQETFANSLKAFISGLSITRWPAPVRGLVAELIAANRQLWTITSSPELGSAGDRAAWVESWETAAGQLSVAAQFFRSALHLPGGPVAAGVR